MKTKLYRIAIFAILYTIVVAWLMQPAEISETVEAPRDSNASYGFGDTRTVGQRFRGLKGLNTITIPVKGVADLTGPLILHIRKDYFKDDIRTAIISPPHNYEEAKFTFSSLLLEQNLVWVLEAPKDPDKTVSVYKEPDSTKYRVGQAYVKGEEIVGNFGFTQMAEQAQGGLQVGALASFLDDNNEAIKTIYIPAIGVVMIAVFMLTALMGRTKRLHQLAQKHRPFLLLVIVGVSLALHVWYSGIIPFINDEGAYLLDANQTNINVVPIRDYSTKGLAYIYTLKAWSLLVPNSIVFLRFFSALCWGAATIGMYFVGSYLLNSRRAGLFAAVIFGLSPTALIVSTPLLLQVMSVPVSLAGLALIILGTRNNNNWLFVLAALVMVLAYFTRVSSIVVVFIGLLMIYLTQSQYRWRWMGMYVLTGLGAAAILAGIAYVGWGFEKMLTLFNLEAFLISHERATLTTQEEPIVRQFVQWARLFWQSSPWLLIGITFLPIPFITRMRSFSGRLIFVTTWILLLGQIYRHWSDMGYLMPSSKYVIHAYAISAVLLLLPVLVFLYILIKNKETREPLRKNAAIIGLTWLGLYAFVYQSWGNFGDNYIVEFIPPLTLLCAFVGQSLFQNFPFSDYKKIYTVVTAVIIFNGLVSISIITQYFHTGTMNLSALQEFIEVVKREVPKDEEIFTAQPAVPALAGRSIVLNYTHPGWYLSEIVGEVSTELRQVYFINPEDLTEYLRNNINYVVTERRTNQVYFSAESGRREILDNDFELVGHVSNKPEPFRLYRRKGISN